MNFNDLLSLAWHREPPAEPNVVQELHLKSGLELPESYLAFLQFSNGGGGDFGIDGGWYYLWPTEEVLQLNRDYGIEEWLPDFFAIGSDGGGEALVFDVRTWRLYKISFTCLAENESIFVSESFAAFIQTIGQGLN